VFKELDFNYHLTLFTGKSLKIAVTPYDFSDKVFSGYPLPGCQVARHCLVSLSSLWSFSFSGVVSLIKMA